MSLDVRNSLEILLLVLLRDSDLPAVGLQVMLLNLAQDLKVSTEVQLQPTVLDVVLSEEKHRHSLQCSSDIRVDTHTTTHHLCTDFVTDHSVSSHSHWLCYESLSVLTLALTLLLITQVSSHSHWLCYWSLKCPHTRTDFVTDHSSVFTLALTLLLITQVSSHSHWLCYWSPSVLTFTPTFLLIIQCLHTHTDFLTYRSVSSHSLFSVSTLTLLLITQCLHTHTLLLITQCLHSHWFGYLSHNVSTPHGLCYILLSVFTLTLALVLITQCLHPYTDLVIYHSVSPPLHWPCHLSLSVSTLTLTLSFITQVSPPLHWPCHLSLSVSTLTPTLLCITQCLHTPAKCVTYNTVQNQIKEIKGSFVSH